MKYVLALTAALATSACATVPTADGSDFKALVARHVAAVQARDLAGVEATITSGDALLLILPTGDPTLTREAYLDFHRSFFEYKD